MAVEEGEVRLVLRAWGAVVGIALAALPAIALAQEEGRALEASEDSMKVIAITLGAIATLFLFAAIGWMYQQRRALHWPFQDPDTPAEHH
jgi:hypothetical protein